VIDCLETSAFALGVDVPVNVGVCFALKYRCSAALPWLDYWLLIIAD
jgi:hypothetical protein